MEYVDSPGAALDTHGPAHNRTVGASAASATPARRHAPLHAGAA